MIKLYGVPLSPYYNKVKIALLEKGVKFEESLMRPSQEMTILEKSPMGKIPFVEINGHALCESTAILEWLEDAYPTASLLPPTPLGRAHARELMLMFDLYLGPACTPLVRARLFGSPLPDRAATTAARDTIVRVLNSIARLAQYGPWLAGEFFSFADISAAAVLPVVRFTSQLLDEDLLAHLPGAEPYLQRLAQRVSVARTWEDRETAIAQLLEARAAQD
jgi:glutathione S-transferase